MQLLVIAYLPCSPHPPNNFSTPDAEMGKWGGGGGAPSSRKQERSAAKRTMGTMQHRIQSILLY